MVLAYFGAIPTAFNSAKSETSTGSDFSVVFDSWALTTGLKASIGLGAILAAFSI